MADVIITTALTGIDDVDRQLQNTTKSAETMATRLKSLGQSLTDTGKTLTKTVTLPMAAAGAGLLKVADDFEQARNALRNATGATGQDLRQLEQVTKSVFRVVPGEIGKMSVVVAELNTRTGETGRSLERMARQVLEAARLTGEDAATLTTEFTQVLKLMGVNAQDSAPLLDRMFKISQDMGITLGALVGNVQEYGAVLKSAGLSAEESAVFIGRMNQAGIDFSRVSPGINQALRKFSEQGLDLRSALDESIRAIQGATSETEALSIATEIFGAEGSTRLTQAIRSGMLPSINDLMTGLEDASGVINDTAQESISFGEEMRLLGQQLITAIEPLGADLINLVRAAMPALQNLVTGITTVIDTFRSLPPNIQSAAGIVAGILGVGGPILIAVGALSSAIGTLVAATGPIGLLIAAAGIIVANWDTVLPVLQSVAVGFDTVGGAIGSTVANVVSTVSSMADAVGQTVGEIEFWLVDKMQAVADAVTGPIDTVIGLFDKAADVLVGNSIVPDMVEAITGWFGTMGDDMIAETETASAGVIGAMAKTDEDSRAAVRNMVSGIGTQAGRLGDVFVKPFDDAVSNVLTSFTGMKNRTADILGTVLDSIVGFVQNGSFSLGSLFNNVLGVLSGSGGQTGAVAGLFQSLFGGGSGGSSGGGSGGGGGAGVLGTIGGAINNMTGGFFSNIGEALSGGPVGGAGGGGFFSNIGGGNFAEFAKSAGSGMAGSALGTFLGEKIFGKEASGIGGALGFVASAFLPGIGPFLGAAIGGFLDSAFGNDPDYPGFRIDSLGGDQVKEIIKNNELFQKVVETPFGQVDLGTRNKPFQGANWRQQAAQMADLVDGFALAESIIAGQLGQGMVSSIATSVSGIGERVYDNSLDLSPWYTERFTKIFSRIPEDDRATIFAALDQGMGETGIAAAVASVVAQAVDQVQPFNPDSLPGFETGGTRVFTQPSLIRVAENGPEVGSFRPLASGGGARSAVNVVLNGPAIFDDITMERFVRDMERRMGGGIRFA